MPLSTSQLFAVRKMPSAAVFRPGLFVLLGGDFVELILRAADHVQSHCEHVVAVFHVELPRDGKEVVVLVRLEVDDAIRELRVHEGEVERREPRELHG